ncbi:uncharacterized protein HMPREF1541_10490 [Cyphellophora europaea CBS 101466]|uniref:Flavin-nucleotide-binding protein n=1 Tax=Cyphellophora europaea (strain CBS 101466) TaxID=1220924 RepID=W2S6P8_CYPE1|nr:uncharacterized protein HMPREF1541_10490 [Cyphellophora europaea CBS 101466]ETN44310.1 hypothetical protein HMPREF1541_10490 [Cyphellophora europaea CBS 101466]
MVRTLEYPKTDKNKVQRYNARAAYDLETIHSTIQTSIVLNVAFAPSPDNPFPIILPMVGAMGSFAHPSASLSEPLDCYVHGYVTNRMARLARDSPQGLPVCVSATKVHGLVLSLTPYSHDVNYKSAVLMGYASIVEDQAEKLWAMELITDKVCRDRWAETRVPPKSAEMSSTGILRIRVEGGSGKVRNGVAHDEREDEEDEALRGRVWTGVVPVMEVYGEPVADEGNKVANVPEYLSRYVSRKTEEAETGAKEAMKE